MTIYKDRSTGDISDEDFGNALYAVQYGQLDGQAGILSRLHRVFPEAAIYPDNLNLWLLLDGTTQGRAVYVDTVVKMVDVGPKRTTWTGDTQTEAL